MVASNDYIYNVPLTNGAILANQDLGNFIADLAAPMTPVNNLQGSYKIWSADDLLRDEVQLVQPGSEFPHTETTISEGTFNCKKRGLDEPVDWEASKEFGSDIELAIANSQYKKALIERDRYFASSFLATGKFANDKQGTVNFTKFDDSASKPISVIEEYKALVSDVYGLPVNAMVITADVARALLQNEDILDRLPVNTMRVPRSSVFEELFDIPEVYILRTVSNTSKKLNATQTKGLIATKKILLYHKGDSSPYSPSAIRIFSRNHGDLDSRGIGIYTYQDTTKESNIIRVKSRYDMVIPSSYLGVYMYDVIA
jgi:hypothetical protein